MRRVYANFFLPDHFWPQADQDLWKRYFEFEDRFADTPAASLTDTSIRSLRTSYAAWLGYNFVIRPEALNDEPGARVGLSQVREFHDYLAQSCRTTTIATQISRLYTTLRILVPDQEWTWLNNISSRLRARAVPTERPVVLSPELHRLGLRLMDAIIRRRRVEEMPIKALRKFRDGLLIATLVEAPMRSRAFVSLNVAQHLRRERQGWEIDVPGEFTKTNHPQGYVLTARLSGYFDLYVQELRDAFRPAADEPALWLTENGRLTSEVLRARFKKRTLYGLGVAITPHMARDAAATFLARVDPQNALAARDLLGHTTLAMTTTYIRGARTRDAGRSVASLLQRRANSGSVSLHSVHMERDGRFGSGAGLRRGGHHD
ncbi:MAG: site-specific integrase [Rhizobiaceae bacterium]|nr:site-specific integrase [Rhizobiaceae bacterium]MCV0404855.1 site-specific integrase [Rhizobiaceae bacterium]